MPDSALLSLTSSAPANAGYTYLVQGGQDRKLFMTAAGVSLVEAANVAAQEALLTGLLAKAGGTMTGQLINSTNGAASTPSLLLSGTPFTGGSATTTKPLVNIETAGATSTGWNTSGTMLGINAPSGFVGNYLDIQLNGVSQFAFLNNGNGFMKVRSGFILQPANSSSIGVIQFSSTAGVGIDRITDYTNNNSFLLLSPYGAAARMQMGVDSASAQVSQQFRACGARIGTDTDTTPTNTFTIAGPASTGTGTGGDLILGVFGSNGGSGTAIGTLNTVLTVVAARKVLNITSIPTSSAGLSSGDIYSNAGILTIVP